MRTSGSRLLCLVLAVLLPALGISRAATYYFSPIYGSDANDGLTWGTAKSNLQSVVVAGSAGNVYNLGAGVYQLTNASLSLPANVVVAGTNRDLVVLVAAPGNRVITGAGTNIFITSARITGGDLAAGGGAGIGGTATYIVNVSNCLVYSNYIRGYSTTSRGAGVAYANVFNSDIFGNVANYHGGGAGYSTIHDSSIYNNASTGGYGGGLEICTAYNTLVYSNAAQRGGGVNSSTLTGSLLYNNYAYTHQGGGAYNSDLYGCSVVSNVSSHNGGGMSGGNAFDCFIAYNSTPLATLMSGGGVYGASIVSNCTVVYNVAERGAGVGASAVFGSTISSNHATGYGGGGQGGSYDSCVFSGNTAGTANDALYSAGNTFNCTFLAHTNARNPIAPYNASSIFANNILWGNASNVHSYSISSSNWTNDPRFLPGTLMPTAPGIIDAANPAYSTASLDSDGYSRTNGTAVDIGAVEYDARPMVLPGGDWSMFYGALASRFSNKTNLTAGSLRVTDMPTSVSGLEAGDLWWDGVNVRVVLP